MWYTHHRVSIHLGETYGPMMRFHKIMRTPVGPDLFAATADYEF